MIPDFTPGFSGYISVEDKNENELFRKDMHSREEMKGFINVYGKSASDNSILKACFLPIRTNNWSNLAKDLFLPTFINRAIKVDDCALRIFLSFFAIILDIVTLIPRVVSTPFRILYNKMNQIKHPLITLINENSAPSEIEKNFSVLKIKIKFDSVDVNEKESIKYADVSVGKGFCLVSTDAFEEIEETPESQTLNIVRNKYVQLDNNNKWISQGSLTIKSTEKDKWSL